MATSAPNSRFQSWLLDRMVEFGFTPMSLARGLGLLDGLVEDWVSGRAIPVRGPLSADRPALRGAGCDVRQVAGLRS